MTKQIWRRNVDVAFGIVTQTLHLGFLLQIEGMTKNANANPDVVHSEIQGKSTSGPSHPSANMMYAYMMLVSHSNINLIKHCVLLAPTTLQVYDDAKEGAIFVKWHPAGSQWV